MDSSTPSQKRSWIIIAPILLGLVLTYMNFEELYIVAVAKDIDYYPFGCECNVPYYYKTAGMYSLICGIFGFIFLCITSAAIWSFFRYKKRIGYISSALIIAVLVVMYFNSKIGT